MRDEELWGAVELTDWDMQRYYECFWAHVRGTATPDQTADFCHMSMYQVGMKVRSTSWKRTFAQYRLEPSDAAAKVLSRIIEKAPRLAELMKHPCPRVLISQIINMIKRELISFKRANTRISTPKTHQTSEDYDAADTRGDSPRLDQFEAAMRLCRESICGDDAGMEAIFRHALKNILRGRGTPRYDEMPSLLSGIVDADKHAHVVYNLKKAIRRYAADLGPNVN